eukprot:c15131_g1_i1.p1 GENE.c15131_g1_i1~~c15131_g1_i1.p1  ORF type:complete len:111 (+),score=15.56 c15131_g1_i1:427-759(+)
MEQVYVHSVSSTHITHHCKARDKSQHITFTIALHLSLRHIRSHITIHITSHRITSRHIISHHATDSQEHGFRGPSRRASEYGYGDDSRWSRGRDREEEPNPQHKSRYRPY